MGQAITPLEKRIAELETQLAAQREAIPSSSPPQPQAPFVPTPYPQLGNILGGQGQGQAGFTPRLWGGAGALPAPQVSPLAQQQMAMFNSGPSQMFGMQTLPPWMRQGKTGHMLFGG